MQAMQERKAITLAAHHQQQMQRQAAAERHSRASQRARRRRDGKERQARSPSDGTFLGHAYSQSQGQASGYTANIGRRDTLSPLVPDPMFYTVTRACAAHEDRDVAVNAVPLCAAPDLVSSPIRVSALAHARTIASPSMRLRTISSACRGKIFSASLHVATSLDGLDAALALRTSPCANAPRTVHGPCPILQPCRRYQLSLRVYGRSRSPRARAFDHCPYPG
ncbi:hypothetical protein DFH11DRAFT_1233862 [Phellopilus nigrolimitatus]|nr:hypothetical protein DFH11DRAFT_1233862 [Phellopilus nigrolimitatus]